MDSQLAQTHDNRSSGYLAKRLLSMAGNIYVLLLTTWTVLPWMEAISQKVILAWDDGQRHKILHEHTLFCDVRTAGSCC